MSIPPDPPPELPDLIDHSRFVRNLARRLLRDDDAAEDVVQETMLAAVKARPSTGRSLRPWLATVARNVIRKRHRGKERLRRREQVASKPEALTSTADLAARAEILQRVVDAVLSLDEPNRSAVLLRYYEDLPPREIAKRLGVGVETVRGRLKRAVKQLRARLDGADPRGRAGWMPAVAGLCGLELPVDIAAAASGTATQGAVAGESAAAATATSAVSLPALAAALLIGGAASLFVTSAATMPGDDLRPRAAPSHAARVDAPSLASLPSGSQPVGPDAERYASAQAANARLRAERDRLTAELGRLALQPLDPAVFTFGWPTDGEAFQHTNWLELAEHVRVMTGLLPEVRAAVASGGSVDPNVQRMLKSHNEALVVFAMTVASDLGTTHANLAYTHPAMLSNLVRALLELAEDPLAVEQREQIRMLGQRWAAETDAVPAVEPGAPALEGMVEAVAARLRFVEEFKRILTVRQRETLYASELEDRAELDLLSPALVFALRRGVPAPDPATLRREIVAKLFAHAGIEGQDPDLFERAAEEWLDAMPGVYEPTTWYAIDLAFPTADALQHLARAQAVAIRAILASGRLSAAEARRLGDATLLLVPMVLAPAGPTGD